MTNLRIGRYVICAAVLLASYSASFAGENPKDTVTAFYNAYLKVKPLGIPTEKQRAELAPYLTPGLTALLKSADEAEQKYKIETKNEVPPLVQGDVFTSLFEGADAFSVVSCDEKDAAATCQVEFSNTNPGDGKTFKWKDGVALEKGKGWLISDVKYEGDWDFAVKGTLTEMLKRVISEEAGD